MKDTGMIRKLDNLGRVVIPKELRDVLEIDINDPIEFFSDGKIIMLRKHYGVACRFCSNADHLTMFKGFFLCKECLDEAKREIGQQLEQLASDQVAATKEHPGADTTPSRQRKSQHHDRIKTLISEQPNLTQKKISEMLGISQPRVHQILKEIRREAK
ncbi:AbrB/MazE/SpoVT family DNA-binding domain-containing protein [Paenibacillus alkalitolerans]|uniref:AbrB/MazE/SpoVT family DNA-binding domain-containing protein n=1 Tax=Paenibacillus alkalitolerans TaxID=2799335 RepID=UPI0018F7D078|nr:AbrB/MazE/SpoVT family DNA-binding domain-containing protein [Paenibacillus alkalitolerans]